MRSLFFYVAVVLISIKAFAGFDGESNGPRRVEQKPDVVDFTLECHLKKNGQRIISVHPTLRGEDTNLGTYELIGQATVTGIDGDCAFHSSGSGQYSKTINCYNQQTGVQKVFYVGGSSVDYRAYSGVVDEGLRSNRLSEEDDSGYCINK